MSQNYLNYCVRPQPLRSVSIRFDFLRVLKRHMLAAVILITGLLSSLVHASDFNLPELGDASSALVSPQKERQLGQTWLRMYRSQVPTFSDPQIYTYVESLLQNLAQHSQLKDRRLELILVKNPTMNAFAVPGGVVGVHTGLFAFAESEGQLASVLAHELAHLSQRHFARGVEKRKQNSIPTMAAMLGSLVLAATAGGDAGLAALTATQAAALDSQLRFSRKNEQEADRIGMLTMANADMNPHAVPDMFERMLRATRYSQRPPEFLLTHPITESRIADSRNRAVKYPIRQIPQSLDYHLMRTRALMVHETSPQKAVQRFNGELNGESLNYDASRYGLVLALIANSQMEEAQAHLTQLLNKDPDRVAYVIAQADILAAAEDYEAALALLQKQRKLRPDNHAINVRLAELLMKAGFYPECERLLEAHVKRRPKDDYVWYLLAEVHGLAGNILGVHEARAEYFVLNGVYDKAIKHLSHALKLAQGNYHKTALLEEQMKVVQGMRQSTL